MNFHYLHMNYELNVLIYLTILTLVNLVKENIQTLYSWLPERTLDYLLVHGLHIVKYFTLISP